jgi:hypothetical protein
LDTCNCCQHWWGRFGEGEKVGILIIFLVFRTLPFSLTSPLPLSPSSLLSPPVPCPFLKRSVFLLVNLPIHRS